MWDLIDEKIGAYLGNEQRRGARPVHASMITLGRVQTPDDVASFVSYLAWT